MPSDRSLRQPHNSLAVNARHFPGGKRLAAEYITNFGSLETFFSGDPTDDAAWESAIAARASQTNVNVAIAPIIRSQQRIRQAPKPALEATAVLEDPRTVAVVTGQQAGLFGGPLYTLLKAISAIRLSRRVQQMHGTPTVAVFWVDSEDHDLDEIRKCSVLDANHRLTSISLPIPAPALTPASAVQLGNEIDTTLDTLAAALTHTDFTSDLLSDLRLAYVRGNGIVDAFAIWLEKLFGELGLIVFNSSDPSAKRLAGELFAREINTAGTTSLLAQQAGEQLLQAGFHSQVSPAPGNVALFLQDGSRRSIRTDGNTLRIGDESIEPRTLLDRFRSDASCLSPNVLLRPVVQDLLFPTVCYVAGPNELAYLAQLKAIYQHFGIPMPLVAPRLSVTLVDTAVIKFLHRTKLEVELFQPQDESALNRLLRDQLPTNVEQTIQATEKVIRDQITSIATAVAEVDPTLTGATESTGGRMERDLRNLRNKVLQAAKRRDETLRRQFTRAQSQLFPLGQPQERIVGSIHFVNRYGAALIERLVSDPTLDTSHHWIIAI